MELKEGIARCYYCNKALLDATISRAGGCPECGSRRMRAAGLLKDEEMDALVAQGFDPAQHGWEQRDNG